VSAVRRDDESTTHRLTAAEKAMRDDPAWLDAEADVHAFRGEAVAREAMRNIGAAKGFTFRARELRYDARGGMTEELARRRFEPGARWTTRWTPGEVFTVRRLDRSGLVARVHFDRCFPESLDTLSSGRGWMFLDLGDANGGHVPPGGWP
jgi:hypothetical protein